MLLNIDVWINTTLAKVWAGLGQFVFGGLFFLLLVGQVFAQDNNPLRDRFSIPDYTIDQLVEILPRLGAEVDEGATRNMTLIGLYGRTCQPHAEEALCSRTRLCAIVQIPNVRLLPDAFFLGRSDGAVVLLELQHRHAEGNTTANAHLRELTTVLGTTMEDTVDRQLEAIMLLMDNQELGRERCRVGDRPPQPLRHALLKIAGYLSVDSGEAEREAARRIQRLF